MTMISDMLLMAGALGAGLYCFVLARRLRRFNDLEKGVGGAVAVLSAQVDDLTRTLSRAHGAAGASVSTLSAVTDRAEIAAKQLELLMASLHDLPGQAQANGVPVNPFFFRHPDGLGRSEGRAA
jgi:hypothetical protein